VLFISRLNAQNEVVYTIDNSPYYISTDLIIPDSASLIIEAGVSIFLDSLVNIDVYGDLIINGTTENPVQLRSNGDYKWGILDVHSTALSVNLQYVTIINGRLNINCPEVTISHMTLDMNYSTAWNEALLKIKNATVSITDSEFFGEIGGDGILIINAENPFIDNCTFYKIADPTEFISCTNGVVSNCTYNRINDDAIDLNNCSNFRIFNNEISRVLDRGLEIGSENFGSSKNIQVDHNLIYDCKIGINVKEGSEAIIENNTLYSNGTAVEIIRSNPSSTGSEVMILNSIFNSNDSDIFADEFSAFSVMHSISDNNALIGINNLVGDPLFVNPVEKNFQLSSDSPCIDKGYELSPLDPDTTIADIGAFYFHHKRTGLTGDIVVYPNPFQDTIYIYSEGPLSSLQIELFDTDGSSLYQNQIAGPAYYYPLNLQFLASGNYLLKIVENGTSSRTFKIVKL
jgi:parallel beta-helix repeat protein